MFCKIKSVIKYVSVISVITVFILIIVEFFCGLFLRFLPILSGIYSHGAYRNYSDYRVGCPAYVDKNYANEIYKELLLMQERYTPYIIWKYSEYHSKYINIDSNGIRATIPKAKAGKKIFFFGGSTLWGTGVADTDTIPSFVSRYLNKDNPVYDIVNYGQSGYQSTQEVIQLILEIQKENIPDIVVFYDGVNDIYAGVFSPGIPGYHQNFEQIKGKIEARGFITLFNNSNFFMLANYLKNRIGREILEEDKEDEDKKIEEAVNIYIYNMNFVKKLSDDYGFKFISFWQPLLLTDTKKLTKYEEAEKFKMGKRLIRIYSKAYGKISKKYFNDIAFTNISKIFENKTNNIYLDFAHLSAEGNSIVARAILDRIKDEAVRK